MSNARRIAAIVPSRLLCAATLQSRAFHYSSAFAGKLPIPVSLCCRSGVRRKPEQSISTKAAPAARRIFDHRLKATFAAQSWEKPTWHEHR